MKEIEVTFETITPLWTGDAWGENSTIRPSSIMGSLRFWFEVYCKSIGKPIGKLSKDNNIPSDNLKDYVKKYDKNETFNSLIQIEIKDKICDYDIALNGILNKIDLPLPLKVFGCTGWKSQLEIKKINYEKEEIIDSDVDFKAIYYQQKDSRFWSKKLLFKNSNNINLFKNIKITLKVSFLVLEDFLKFLKFYENKVIIIGGKKSFGLGFSKIKTSENLENISLNRTESVFDFKEINVSNYNSTKNKIILGFNFKHYQRLKEDKDKREKNFGKQGIASNFFFSAKLKNQDKIYLVAFNNYQNNNEFYKLFEKYSKFN